MNWNVTRNIIRAAMLMTAWLCGFLFYALVGEEWRENGLLKIMTDGLTEFGNLLEGRLRMMDMDSKIKEQILALTLGRRGGLGEETKMIFRESGTSHLLALSGMHLGILYGLLQKQMHVWYFGKRKWVAFTLAMILIWSYAIMTGMPKSLLRAAMMLSFAIMSELRSWNTRPQDIIVACACLVFLLDPGALVDVGFQLSCMAVLGICVLGIPAYDMMKPYMMNWRYGGSRLVKFVASSLCISISAQLFTLPISIYYFHSFAPYSAIISLLAIPLTVVIVYTSLPLYAGITCLVPVCTLLFVVLRWTLTLGRLLPYSYIQGLEMPLWLMPVYYFPLYILVKWIEHREYSR